VNRSTFVAAVEKMKGKLALSLSHVECTGYLDGTAAGAQSGASLIEYALLVALVSLVAIASIREVGVQIDDNFGQASLAMQPQQSRPGGTTRGPPRR
jgi:Flp pilus assembly pilin Flp